MKKEWLIILGLGIIILILIFIVFIPNSLININLINQRVNNSNNNSILVNLSDYSGENGVCGPCKDVCIEHAEAASCPLPDGSFRCQVINNVCTKILLNNNKDCEEIGNQIWQELSNNQGCSINSDCKLGDLQVPCTMDNCGRGAIYNKNLDKTKIESLTNEYMDKGCQQGCPGCAAMNNQIVKCISRKCGFVLVNICTSNSECPSGYICIRYVEGMTNKYGGVYGTPENPGNCILKM